MSVSFVAALLLVALSVAMATTPQQRVLVILDAIDVKRTHASYFKELASLGYELTFKAANDATLELSTYGVLSFEHVLFFAPSANSLAGSVDSASLLEFIDAGHNVLVVGGGSGKVSNEIASHSAIQFDSKNVVIDHAHHHVGDEHTAVLSDASFAPVSAAVILGATKAPSLLFQGAAISSDSPLVVPLVRAHPTAYTGNADGTPGASDAAFLAGFDVTLVAALHARNGARVTAAGSLALFSDDFTDRSPAGGVAARSTLVRLTAWTFGRRGVLRARNVDHRAVGEIVGNRIGQYRVGQQIVFDTTIEEWNGDKNEWVPYVADDVQLEFTMLDPYVRQFLKPDAKGKYSLEFKLPDVYGVFTFRIMYQRPGYTPLQVETRVPVRPLRHDEYERFIPSAYPYYASSFSMMIGLFVFSFAFLYHSEPTKK